MVWLLEKKLFYHEFDFGFRKVTVPIRVKFDFEVQEGALVQESLSIQSLYNKEALARLYPKVSLEDLDEAINETVHQGVTKYLLEAGFITDPGELD